ncbi:hypothetical protein TrLO_g3028 [Triparma laevis f. longispina]|uniref:Rhodanese domain-containing protein n=1 Tax=Triparma laevis f. longispina TaxID=1714387 RepID=A0A9W7ACI2_9STRA|nr:hypothetical protein TrLO_g3028 [Triparma laevis f. longispina]
MSNLLPPTSSTTPPTPYVNSSGYIFHPLSAFSLPIARAALLKTAKETYPDLMGTILIATEGINVRLSGPPSSITSFKILINGTFNLTLSNYKDVTSSSCTLPRFLIKIKNHLIKFPLEMPMNPNSTVATHINTNEMKTLLSQGAQLFDTRNDYEFKLGKFKNAATIESLKTFQDLPSKLSDVNFKSNKVIMYCTGGIRCEKAQYMSSFPPNTELYQLNGGILKYFEEDPSSALWEGGLFVFDERKCINSQGEVIPVDCCFKCRNPIEIATASTTKGLVKCNECGYDDFYNVKGEERRRSTGKKRKAEPPPPQPAPKKGTANNNTYA